MSRFISAVKTLLKKVLKSHSEMHGDHSIALQPSEEHWIARSPEGRRHCANSRWAWHTRLTPTDPMVWARRNDIKANLQDEKRSRVHLPVLGEQRALRSVWMELWEAVVYTHAFNGNIAKQTTLLPLLCNSLWFYIKIVLRHWRDWKATSNIWKELLLFTSFFYEILLQNV